MNNIEMYAFQSELTKEALWGGGIIRPMLRTINKTAPGFLNKVKTNYLPAAGNLLDRYAKSTFKNLEGIADRGLLGGAPQVAKNKFFTPGKVLVGGVAAGAGGLMWAGSQGYKNPGDNYSASYGNAFGGGFQPQG